MGTRTSQPMLAAETRLLFLITFAVCVVIPHSLQAVTAGLLLLTAVACLFVMQGAGRLSFLGICYVLGAINTCIFLIVGVSNGAPPIAVAQTVAIYIVSPLLWIVILGTALQLMTARQLIRYMALLAWLCCASVALFFFLYINFGRGAVTFFIEEANLHLQQGFSGATMNVYGSLIFLSGAFFAAPEVIKGRLSRVLLLGALAACALTSGRAAFILAMPVGLLIGLLVRERDGPGAQRTGRWMRYGLSLVSLAAVILLLDAMVEQVDLGVVGGAFWEKLLEGGGEERLDQAAALWDGIRQGNGLGMGHGIGVELQRSEDYPWRYENVPLAIVFKTGFIGAAIYALPFLLYLAKMIRLILHKRIDLHDKFLLGGMISVLLAAATNPYVESFIFQWMYVLPIVGLVKLHRGAGQADGIAVAPSVR